MSGHSATRLGWLLCGLSVLLTLVGLLLCVLAREAQSYYLERLPVLLILAVLGALVAGRHPGNAIGWLFLAAGLMIAATIATGGYAVLALSGGRSLAGGVAAAWLGSWLALPALFGIPPLVFLLFPDGRPLTRRWAVVLWLIGASAVMVPVVGAMQPGDLTDIPVSGVPNPVGSTGWFVTLLGNVGFSWTAGGLVLAIVSLVLRYRRSAGQERLQMRWLVSAASLFLFTFAVTVGVYGTPYEWLGDLVVVGLAAIPLATGLAILRYRLYDIDLVVNRTLVYGSLTVTLAVVYLTSVLLLRLAVEPLTGRSDLAVAASTLAVAALFRPLRSRIQTVVDRRFYRRRYDAARTLESFSGRLRQQVDLDTLTTDLRSVVRDTVQPAHVSLWLRGAGRGSAVTIPERARSRKVSP